MDSRIEELKKKCEYVEQFTGLISVEIAYWNTRLPDSQMPVLDEYRIRERVYTLFNTYLGLFSSPDGIVSRIVADTRSKLEEKPIVDELVQKMGKEYLRLVKEYRKKLNTSKKSNH